MAEKPALTAEEFIGSETGNRSLEGTLGKIVVGILIAWTCFQLWYASPIPFALNFGVFNEDQAKFIHLAFAVFLGFTLFPFSKSSSKHINWLDITLGLVAAATAIYLLIFREQLSVRTGLPTSTDVFVAITGIILLLEATRRTLGLPLVIISVVFLIFTFGGQYMPDVIAHKGASLKKVASHQWLTTEGVFGVAIGVSTAFVFLFVLLGTLLDRAGAGNYLIKVSFALIGHMRGGPAKAAVIASGLSGIISGSSIANVVTTGTFTIPLMKRVGFPGTKAGAIEVAASTNGQLTPPIMGAAAFLMIEYVGISYLEVVKHAILPSIISYIALVYIVHLEAVKLNMQGIQRSTVPTLAERGLVWVTNILILMALGVAVYYGSNFLESTLGDFAGIAMIAVITVAYVWLVKLAAQYPDLADDTDSIQLDSLPAVRPTVMSGLYFSIPIIVLLWALGVKRFSPQQSAFFAVVVLIGVVLTHKPLKDFFRNKSDIKGAIKQSYDDLVGGMIDGARNMITIGIATAAAGIIVGTVTLTGLGQMMTELVEFISGGNLMLILFFTAVICIILGMGLPTTANYIVVSTLMAPVIVSLAAQNGLVVPLIAVHLFVFYFGILADDTPPVGLAAYAAAAISGDDPIKTGIQGFTYDIRTAVLPFMFIFNTQLLLIDIGSVWQLILVIFGATSGILIFSAATQGYWFTKTKWIETIGLLLIAFAFFRPDFFWDRVFPPTSTLPATELITKLESLQKGQFIDLNVEGETLEGQFVKKTVTLQSDTDGGSAIDKLQAMGLELSEQENAWKVDTVGFGSAAEKAGVDFDWLVTGIQEKTSRPAKELLYIPAILLALLIAWFQRRRLAAISAN